MLKKYRIGDRILSSTDEHTQEQLGHAYASRSKIYCACNKAQPVEMYIAKISATGIYEVRRMPGDGSQHRVDCAHYEPPLGVSGLAQVRGQAILEDLNQVELKLDFSLTKLAGRAMPAPKDTPADSVKSDPTKLTLRGLLHYLWHCAGLDKWYPAMAGKRTYGAVYKYLNHAVIGKKTKADQLADLLYVPEPYDRAREAAAKSRRVLKMAQLSTKTTQGATRLGLVIGELYELRAAQFGRHAIFKGALDCPFLISDDLYKRLVKHFEAQLTMWDQNIETTHLMFIGTYKMDPVGVPMVMECCVMVVTQNWIPFETLYELGLINALTQQGREYWKCMRFNLPQSAPMANVILTDTVGRSTAMCILPAGATQEERDALLKAVAPDKHDMDVWVWRSGEEELVALPPKRVAGEFT